MLKLHATTVAFGPKAVLIRGASGSGKSTLALNLIALGAELIADDYTILTRDPASEQASDPAQLIASCPDPLTGQIEARGIGILNAPCSAPQPVALIVDLDQESSMRLPPEHADTILDVQLPVVYHCNTPGFAAAIKLYALYGRAH